MSQSSLKFLDYIVKDINISTSSKFLNSDKENIRIAPTYFAEIIRNDDTKSMVILDFELDNSDDSKPFGIQFSIIGIFELDSTEYSEEEYINLLKSNAVAILFPYMRSLVTDLTAKMNISMPIILPAMNIVNLLEDENNYKITSLDDFKNPEN